MVQRERCWPVHDECRRAFADGVVDNNDGYTLAKVRTQHTRRRRPCDEHASSVFCTVKVHAEPAHAPAACPARRRLRYRWGAPSAFCRGGSKPARQRCAKQGELCRWIHDADQHDEHGDACSHACWASRICCNKSEVPMALTRFQEQTLCFFPPHCSRPAAWTRAARLSQNQTTFHHHQIKRPFELRKEQAFTAWID